MNRNLVHLNTNVVVERALHPELQAKVDAIVATMEPCPFDPDLLCDRAACGPCQVGIDAREKAIAQSNGA